MATEDGVEHSDKFLLSTEVSEGGVRGDIVQRGEAGGVPHSSVDIGHGGSARGRVVRAKKVRIDCTCHVLLHSIDLVGVY